MNVSAETSAKRYPPSRHLLDVVRPGFFPGQSLSDRDLTALITWAEQRFRLEAACDDWGIACGLHVSINPDDHSQVLISPGYGFNVARQLCVVSGSDCGCDEKPRCKCRNKKSKTFCLPKANCAGCLPGDPVNVGPLKVAVKMSELAIFDLRLAPEECEQQHSLGLTTDGRRNCNPSRFKAAAEVSYNLVIFSPPCDEEDDRETTSRAIERLKRYLPEKSKVLTPEKPEMDLSPDDIARIGSLLAEDVKQFPELLCLGLNWKERLESGINEAKLAEILSWLVFGLRRARMCKSYTDDQTIPLCRIWAKCIGGKYEILWIDESTPFRRSLHCGPRRFCVTDWIGESFIAANHAAKVSGVNLEATPWVVPRTREDLINFLKDEIKLADDQTLELLDALYVEMPSSDPDVCNHRIVVGFQARGAESAQVAASGSVPAKGGTPADVGTPAAVDVPATTAVE